MKRILLVGFFVLFVFSCEDEIVSNIPWAPVDLMLYLNDQDSQLNGALSFKKFTTARAATDRLGYGGILVINGFGADILNLRAYDLSCPVEAQRDALIVPDNEGRAKCSRCGAVYNIASSGAPVSGSKFSLRQYKVSADYSGSGRYRVTN